MPASGAPAPSVTIPLRPPGPRVTRLAESLQALRGLLDGGAATVAGAEVSVDVDDLGSVEFVDGFTPGTSPGLVTATSDIVMGPSLVSLFEIGGYLRQHLVEPLGRCPLAIVEIAIARTHRQTVGFDQIVESSRVDGSNSS